MFQGAPNRTERVLTPSHCSRREEGYNMNCSQNDTLLCGGVHKYRFGGPVLLGSAGTRDEDLGNHGLNFHHDTV